MPKRKNRAPRYEHGEVFWKKLRKEHYEYAWCSWCSTAYRHGENWNFFHPDEQHRPGGRLPSEIIMKNEDADDDGDSPDLTLDPYRPKHPIIESTGEVASPEITAPGTQPTAAPPTQVVELPPKKPRKESWFMLFLRIGLWGITEDSHDEPARLFETQFPIGLTLGKVECSTVADVIRKHAYTHLSDLSGVYLHDLRVGDDPEWHVIFPEDPLGICDTGESMRITFVTRDSPRDFRLGSSVQSLLGLGKFNTQEGAKRCNPVHTTDPQK